MAYKQINNPLSRKTSPLRDKGNHPHPHNKPGVISIESPETASTSVHRPSEYHPKLEGQPMPDVDYEHISDMEEAGIDQPNYEDPDWKPGMPRKSSSPLNKHGEWQKKIDAAKAKWDKEQPEGDFYEVYAHLFKAQEKAKKAHKEGPSRKSSSPLNTEETSEGEKRNQAYNYNDDKKESEVKFKPKTAKDAGKVDSSGREGTNRQERKKRRKERRAIRKDKTLSRSQKTMAKKESRQKQRENVRGVKK